MKHFDFLTGDRGRDQRNVDLLLGAVEQLYGHGDLAALFQNAVDSALEVTSADRGMLLLPDDRGRLVVRVARDCQHRDLPKDVRYSHSVVQRVWETGKPDMKIDTARMGAPSASWRAENLHSIIAAPLPGRERPIGVLYVDSVRAASGFSSGDEAVFGVLARVIATAIEQQRLRHTQQELDVARDIQLRMAPKGCVAPPGFDVACEGRSAVETSGDYHDVIPQPDGRLALVVGDVAGHGLGSALYMTSARAALRSLLRARGEPLELLGDLNAYFCHEMRPNEFLTLFVAVVDPTRKTLRWAGAGHAALHWRRAGGFQTLSSTGPALGLDPGARYGQKGPIDLAPGDAVILATDGIEEARTSAGEMFGEDRLLRSIAAHAARVPDARGLLDGILDDLGTYLVDRRPEDDVTCVVLRALPSPS